MTKGNLVFFTLSHAVYVPLQLQRGIFIIALACHLGLVSVLTSRVALSTLALSSGGMCSALGAQGTS